MTEQTLENVLEDMKSIGNYAIDIRYGEDLGADDSDIAIDERNIKIAASTAGTLGSARTLFVGTIEQMRKQCFKNAVYTLVSNPPMREEIEDAGYYIWGSDGGIDTLRNRLTII